MAFKAVIERQGYSRRERLRTLMREDILAAARKIVLDAGYKGLSMRFMPKAFTS